MTINSICGSLSKQDCPNPFMSKPGQEIFPRFDFLSSRREVPASTFHLLHPIFIPVRCTLRNSLKTQIKYFGAKAQNG